MASQYWVGNFFVDITRNQITQKAQSKTIPPKALAVLTYLAKNANKVVSHDELLSEVWPDTVVTPNTLQRSIAQLRKALDENNQELSYIKTHAKQGYSLEVEVRWQESNKALTENETHKITSPGTDGHDTEKNNIDSTEGIPKGNSSSSRLKPIYLFAFIFALMFALSFIAVSYLTPEQPLKLSIAELRSLTTTDNKEHSGVYSPDGEYIVFNRYSEEFCSSSNIWAKNIKTQKETQLTDNMGRYGSHSFSKDGKKLVFIKTENCEKPINQKDCYKLMTLDFEKALTAPQSPSLLMECKNSKIVRSKWLKNNNIALLQEHSNHWKLTSYSITDNKSTVIYSIEGGGIIDYDYSTQDDIIAVTSIHSDGQNYIEILKPDGQLLSSHQVEYPPEIPNLSYIYPNFSPLKNQLIFSTGRQLFALSYNGKITNISLPLDEPISSPTFHPNGKRALMIKGHWDSDIAIFSLAQGSRAQSVLTPTILERSTREEDDAIYQPKGALIAYKSDRSGEDQVWLTDGNDAQQLTHFPIDSYIFGLDWAADGQSVLVNVNYRLTQVKLDSSDKSFPFDHRIEQLFQWHSEENTALVTARIKGVLTFGQFDLNNSAFTTITDKKVKWAVKSEDGRLIYTDQMDRFWQPGPAEEQLIESLENQGSDKKFIIKDNIIYGVNDVYQLWSYALNEQTFKIISQLPNNVDTLTDLHQEDFLTTTWISAKKEVAELTLNE